MTDHDLKRLLREAVLKMRANAPDTNAEDIALRTEKKIPRINRPANRQEITQHF